MWEDKTTYWAWRGDKDGYSSPPTNKVMDYADFGDIKIACAVYDDGVKREINQAEIAWHGKYGTYRIIHDGRGA